MAVKQGRRDTARDGSPADSPARVSPGGKTPRWELILHEDGSHGWSWHRLAIDGSIEQSSGPYPDFGLAMGDAVKNGFCAQNEDWTIRTRKGTTYFPPGKTPFLM